MPGGLLGDLHDKRVARRVARGPTCQEDYYHPQTVVVPMFCPGDGGSRGQHCIATQLSHQKRTNIHPPKPLPEIELVEIMFGGVFFSFLD